MTPEIRPAEAGDVPALRAMMAGSNGYAPGPQREMIETYAAGWELKPAAEVWVLRDAEGVAGFYALIPWGEGDRELDLFFTADDRQGRGYGRLLYEHMTAAARSLGASRLKIVSNPAAAAFYARMGARATGMDPPGSGISWPRPRFEVELTETG